MPRKGQKSKRVVFRTFIGLDPGVSGGLAVVLDTGEVFLRATSSLPTNIDLLDWMLQWRNMAPCGAIEQLVAYRAGTDHPSSRMIQYGRSYGRLEVAAAAAGVGLEEVAPARWQRHFSLERARDEARPEFKRRMRERAGEVYPHLKGRVTLDNCDALLLAVYCKHLYGQEKGEG
jgi:hypothetical protein